VRYLAAFIFCLLACLPASAEPYYMSIARDLEKTGDIASHKDDMEMRMTWVYNHPSWLVEEGVREFFEDGEYGLEKYQPGRSDSYFETRWLVQGMNQVPFTLLGAEQIRTRLFARVKPLEENKTEVLFTVELQVQDKERISSGWVDRSERLAREYIWIAASSTGVSVRYPGNKGIFDVLIADYRKNKKRHGVKGYELPPREVAKKPEPKVGDPTSNPGGATAPAPSRAEEIKKLKDLLDAGAITPEEYEAAKAKLLKS
jgi:hypothetical protein